MEISPIEERKTPNEKTSVVVSRTADWKDKCKDDREHSRIEVTWPSSISTSSGSIDGELRNISLGGALFLCRELPNLEDTFALDILAPKQQSLNTTARIVRLDVCDHDCDSLSFRLAVRFAELGDVARKLLCSAISDPLTANVDEEHCEDISTSFHTQLEESNLIVETLYRCFNDKGDFEPESFLNQTDSLKSHHERVFHLLLRYLKEAENRKSRVSLVNSIPVFYDQINSARSIVRILLAEFCNQARSIHYADRNMLMLGTQLLRHYRKEDGMQIETTPEEVLLVREGLRGDTVELARETLAELNRQIRDKLSVINRTLISSLSQPYPTNSNSFSLRFIIALLREFNILMALIGGPQAKTIMREQAFFLSNPKSNIYKNPSNKQHHDIILGLLRINIKGYLRLLDGELEEYDHLKALKSRIDSLSLGSEEARKLLLRRLAGLIENHLR